MLKKEDVRMWRGFIWQRLRTGADSVTSFLPPECVCPSDAVRVGAVRRPGLSFPLPGRRFMDCRRKKRAYLFWDLIRFVLEHK
jgi:hypothetical protein